MFGDNSNYVCVKNTINCLLIRKPIAFCKLELFSRQQHFSISHISYRVYKRAIFVIHSCLKTTFFGARLL